jgi:hypothetical protein
MKFFIEVLMLVAPLLLTGCVSQAPHPDWIDGNTEQYSRSQFLMGRGEAATVADAKELARLELVQLFTVKNTVPGDVDTKHSVPSAQFLEGMKFVELWLDPLSKKHHALAVIPRMKTITDLSQKITQLDEFTQLSVDQAQSAADPLIEIASSTKAYELQLERDGLQKILVSIDEKRGGIAVKFDLAQLKLAMTDSFKRVRVVNQVLEGSIAGLSEIVNEALSQAGFAIESREKSDFLLKASFKLTDLGRKDGRHGQRGNLEISVSEIATGRVRGSQRWPIKSFAEEKNMSIKRALLEAQSILKNELGMTMIGMAVSK